MSEPFITPADRERAVTWLTRYEYHSEAIGDEIGPVDRAAVASLAAEFAAVREGALREAQQLAVARSERCLQGAAQARTTGESEEVPHAMALACQVIADDIEALIAKGIA